SSTRTTTDTDAGRVSAERSAITRAGSQEPSPGTRPFAMPCASVVTLRGLRGSFPYPPLPVTGAPPRTLVLNRRAGWMALVPEPGPQAPGGLDDPDSGSLFSSAGRAEISPSGA